MLRLRLSQPVAGVLFDGNAHQLTARTHAGFVEQLLQYGFDGTLRDLQIPGNLLVRETFEHRLKDGSLAGAQRLDRALVLRFLTTPATRERTARGSSHMSPPITL